MLWNKTIMVCNTFDFLRWPLTYCSSVLSVTMSNVYKQTNEQSQCWKTIHANNSQHVCAIVMMWSHVVIQRNPSAAVAQWLEPSNRKGEVVCGSIQNCVFKYDFISTIRSCNFKWRLCGVIYVLYVYSPPSHFTF